MIKFTRKGTRIRVEVAPNIPGADTWVFYFDRNESSEPAAQLLVNAFNDKMEQTLKATRQEFYDQGYRDAKAKRKKCDWIRGWW